MKASKCRMEITMRCLNMVPDIACRYYRESRRQPLQCAYHMDDECLNSEAIRQAWGERMPGYDTDKAVV